MKYIFFVFIIIINMKAALITGDQDKVSVVGATMLITSQGKTVEVKSGEIVYLEDGKAPSAPSKLKQSDLSDIIEDLRMVNISRFVNLKFAPVKEKVAQEIRRFLIQSDISSTKIKLVTVDGKKEIYVRQININKIKDIYPHHHKAVLKYFSRNKVELKQKSNTPTILFKVNIMKAYHKSIFNKFN